MKKLAIVAVVVAAAIGGVSYANHALTQEVKVEVDRQLALMNQQMGMTASYEDISASVFGQSVEISNMVITGFDQQAMANIASIEVSGYETDKIAPRTELTIKNFTFSEHFLAQLPPDANNNLASASYDLHTLMNYDEKSGDSDIAFDLNANKIVALKFNLGLAKSTALMNASLALSKMQQELGAQQPTLEQQLQQQTIMMEALSELEPRSIEIALNNEGEFKALVEQALEKQGMTLEQMQQMVDMQLQQAPVSEELGEAIKNFTQGLGSLTVSASLPEGQTMTEINQQIFTLMGQPEELAEFINLKAKGE
ncbi:hypothetical protein [Pseudoalteromonas prydzensis]|uniref:hypothetical protein n=1 Tax=Pseudoalteromonas prydzensis TaxID=182141 RepID=UPI0007E4DFB8|nr:hypothetical protein [Pseudoalteromonas prydzensis]MBE0377987.1 hypothetical protein [Pseudoalteromonas prydzensis ACAM 620]